MDMDVVTRLRRQDGLAFCQEAADEIEALRGRLETAERLLREWLYVGTDRAVEGETRAFLNDTEPAEPPSADPVGYGWKDGRYGPVTTEAAASTRHDEETT